MTKRVIRCDDIYFVFAVEVFTETLMFYMTTGIIIHCVPNNIPDIYDYNLKTNEILLIFGMNIPDTTCRQMTIHFPTLPNVFLHYLGKTQPAKYHFLSNTI